MKRAYKRMRRQQRRPKADGFFGLLSPEDYRKLCDVRLERDPDTKPIYRKRLAPESEEQSGPD